MTYYEIIIWIQNHVLEINEVQLGKYEITYCEDFSTVTVKSTDLIKTILEINELDLIK